MERMSMREIEKFILKLNLEIYTIKYVQDKRTIYCPGCNGFGLTGAKTPEEMEEKMNMEAFKKTRERWS